MTMHYRDQDFEVREVRVGHIFCGLGGGARGFNRGHATVGNMRAKFRCLGGIDVDPASIRDFERLSGVPGTVLDLFSLEQYLAFHGRIPPAGWRQAMPADLQRAFNNERPHIIFLSAPCKGFSGLLSETASKTDKYQALNALTLRGVWLALEAYKDDPVELFVFENVPRIAKRGRWLLDQITALFRAYGYAVAETTHDCGELGGLAQSRKRFLLVARHMGKVPNYLYEPPKHRLRGVGEVLDKLPVPGLGIGGPMHRVPSLQWKTWVRLAFVEAGSDWRSLNRLRVEDGFLADYGIEPEAGWHADALGVMRWSDASGTVTSRAGATNGRFSVADPRVDGHHKSVQLGIRHWHEPAAVVKGDVSVGTGPYAVADPRIEGKRFNSTFRIVPFAGAAPAVAGPGGPGSGLAVADPRAAGGYEGAGKYRVTGIDEHAGAVIAGSTTGQGAFALADPRLKDEGRAGPLGVHGWQDSSGTIAGESFPSNGGFAVADPRYAHGAMGSHTNKMAVQAWDDPARAVIGSDRVGSGAMSVADPRPVCLNGDHRDGYMTQGHYGVLGWDETANAVPAFAKNNNGAWSVADPRGGIGEEAFSLPGPNQQLIAVIRALDGTWHRPFTTLELAALQGLVDPEEQLELDGLSDSAWRERIGNAVPPPAAEAIANVMGRTLLLAWSGETFMLSNEPIWVRPVVTGLMAAGALQE